MAKLRIGDAARAARTHRGLTQRAAARELGLSHVHLSNLENDLISPTVNTLEKFQVAWGIDIYLTAADLDGRKLRLKLNEKK